MQTYKFDRMIEAFECDFSLIKEGEKTFAELDKAMKDSRYSLSEDMELMQELSTMLRYGQAEIHLVNETKTNADRIRNMTDEELADILFDDCIDKMGLEMCKYIDDGSHDCKKCVLEWLQAEAKEGAE